MSPVSSRLPSLLDTYSADFQKCPGWESLRFSLGSFSSMSASWVKVGLSLRSYAQQAERISWRPQTARLSRLDIYLNKDLEISSVMFIICHRLSVVLWMTARQLTVTSLPRLISANTFLMPSPLPTCQMVASTGWLVIGQSLAWSSYQMVLERKKEGTAHFFCQTVLFSEKLSQSELNKTGWPEIKWNFNDFQSQTNHWSRNKIMRAVKEPWRAAVIFLSWWQYKEITNVPHRQL